MGQEGRAAVVPAARQPPHRRRRTGLLRQGSHQVLRPGRRGAAQRRGSRRATGRRPARFVPGEERHPDALVREHRRLCRRGHDGRHLGHRRQLRADRQERASFRRRRHRRRARTAAGQSDHHRGQLLHRRPLGGRRRRDRRGELGAFDGRLHRPEHARSTTAPPAKSATGAFLPARWWSAATCRVPTGSTASTAR